MQVHGGTDILTLSNTQARDLAGRFVIIAGVTYYFKSYDPDHPGQPPWRSGAEGKAYPLLGRDGSMAAYLKFFTHPTQKRLDRTAWLIGQQMHTWLPNLAAAPVLWTDTRHGLHGAKSDFQFAAYLAKAVPGETWLERKSGIAGGGTCFPEELRWRCVRDLLLALAALERAELVHGDLSPNNVVVDLHAPPRDPALYLIDFDAFFAAAAGTNRAVTVAEGGTYGTEGYCPPDLAAAASAGDASAAPYSDRYGRDMLLLEFLLMGSSLPADDPLARWDREQLQRQFAAWRARSDPKCVRTLGHLDPATVFALKEPQRPTSVDLAIGLGLSLPERRALRRVTELTRPTPAMLGCRPAVTTTDGGSRAPAVVCRRRAVGRWASSQCATPASAIPGSTLSWVVGAIVAICFLIAVQQGVFRVTAMTEAERKDEAKRQSRAENQRQQDEQERQSRAEKQRQQDERDRQASYRRYKEHQELEGLPVESYDEWWSIDDYLGGLICVPVAIAVFIVPTVFLGYVVNRDRYTRDYGGRSAARLIALVRGSNLASGGLRKAGSGTAVAGDGYRKK